MRPIQLPPEPDYPGQDYFHAHNPTIRATEQRWHEKQANAAKQPVVDWLIQNKDKPDGWAYLYASWSWDDKRGSYSEGQRILRYSNGETINGCDPIAAIPLYFGKEIPCGQSTQQTKPVPGDAGPGTVL
jgi:hypothetical protein